MTYTKQTWTTGDVITADKLNHMEDGIADIGGGIVLLNVTQTPDTAYHLGKSYSEITEIIESGNIPVAVFDGDRTFIMPFLGMSTTGSQYTTLFLSSGLSGSPGLEIFTFNATTATEELVHIDIG